jgi:hypothetical protein
MNKLWVTVHPWQLSPLVVASEEVRSLEIRGNEGYLVSIGREGSRTIIEIDFALDKKCVKFMGVRPIELVRFVDLSTGGFRVWGSPVNVAGSAGKIGNGPS